MFSRGKLIKKTFVAYANVESYRENVWKFCQDIRG